MKIKLNMLRTCLLNIALLTHPLFLSATILPAGYPCHIFEPVSQSPSNDTSCRAPKPCEGFLSAKFRTVDGTCNNIQMNSLWGSAGSEFIRLVERNPLETFGYPPIFQQKQSKRFISSARAVSSAVHGGRDQSFSTFTAMLMQFGQILDHDITLTAEMNMCHENEECIEEEMDCCEYINHMERPKSCFPIQIPDDDPFYRVHFPKPTCLDFKRSLPFPCNYSSPSDVREQFNEVTAFLDASHLYDADPEKAWKLRVHTDGLMLESTDGLMPLDKLRPCERSHLHHPQFMSGDIRGNENPGLQSHHTLWLREHNRLARSIKALSPEFSDERIYQEARRLIIAEWQHIVFTEFLPLVLGRKTVDKLELAVDGPSLYKEYLNPNVANVFATAAFRFGHSLIPDKINMRYANHTSHNEQLKDNFFNTYLMRDGNMEDMLNGMCYLNAEVTNNVINDAIRNFLFIMPGKKFGSDLVARNIQRGRDHELGSYNSYRLACGLRALPGTFFSQPPPELTSKMWSKFSSVYHSPYDIEIFPGGMSETYVEGGIIGPTFACIIGGQFRKVKFADRYFFSHVNVDRNIRFCAKELEMIRTRTFRDVLCENTNIAELTLSPFQKESPSNPMISCTNTNRFEPRVDCEAEANEHDHFVPSNDVLNQESNSGEVIILVGGYNGWQILDSVELYSPNGTCQHLIAPLPQPTYGAQVLYVDGTLLVCGGRTPNGNAGTQCWRFLRDNGLGTWEQVPNLATTHPRWLAAGSYAGDKYFVSGGWSSSNTTEYYDPEAAKWIPFVPTPNYRKRHCMITYMDTLVLIGGSASGSKVDYYNLTSQQWHSLADLTSFRSSHSCILVPNTPYVLVFGGLKVTTLYNILTGQSVFGPRSQVSRSLGAVMELNGHIYVLGGDSHANVVERYSFREHQFTTEDTGLKLGRSRFGVAKVPAAFFQHLPNGCKA
ncbi:peroxidase-like isoform X2 [Tigriopus californicus]|nr:peroxidase-like isoform X2 [Tigriopus californicus]